MKDYAKYFDFTSAKVIKQENGKTTYRINGRDVAIHSAPNYIEEKRRGKEGIEVHYDFHIPEEMQQFGKGKYYYLRTYGCQMNEHDSETMMGIFEQMGYQSTEDKLIADVILLNTCAVRENAEDKVFGELGHLKALKQQNPSLILGVCGCMAQEAAVVNRISQKHPFVDLIFGTHNIHRLPQLLKEAFYGKEMVIEVWSKEGDIIENLPQKRQGLKAWVNIMYGCDKFCTYCIVPYTRGKERSRRPQDVIGEVRDLARKGFKEIMLLGQNVNAYGKDFTDIHYTFANLMEDISKVNISRVRFTTSHPKDFDDDLIEVLSTRGNLVEHIHLPVQSGSTEVLKRMNRKYSRDDYLILVDKIKKAIPDVVLTTDIIVGFPGETEEQFKETISLVRAVGFDLAFTFNYSPREGTPAAAMVDNVPDEVKKARLQLLNETMNELSKHSNDKLRGQIVEVLVEGESKNDPEVLAGRTRTNKLVLFNGTKDLTGKMILVKITETQTWILKGETISDLVEVERV